MRDDKGNIIETKNWVVTAFDVTRPASEKKNASSKPELYTAGKTDAADGQTTPTNDSVSRDKGNKNSGNNNDITQNNQENDTENRLPNREGQEAGEERPVGNTEVGQTTEGDNQRTPQAEGNETAVASQTNPNVETGDLFGVGAAEREAGKAKLAEIKAKIKDVEAGIKDLETEITARKREARMAYEERTGNKFVDMPKAEQDAYYNERGIGELEKVLAKSRQDLADLRSGKNDRLLNTLEDSASHKQAALFQETAEGSPLATEYREVSKKVFDGINRALERGAAKARIIADAGLLGKIVKQAGVMKQVRRDETALSAVNEAWNRSLDDYKDGKLKSSDVLSMGKPLAILKASGLKEGRITVTQSTLADHLDAHDLTTEDLKNLAVAIQRPMLVYNWGEQHKRHL